MKRTIIGLLTVATICVGQAQDAFNKARVALSSKDTAAAFAGFQDAVKTGQKASEANYYLGAISFARGRVDDAIPYLTSSLRSNDENVDALKTLGDAYVAKKDLPNALAQFKKASKLAPKNADVAVGYGLALLAADSVDAAIRQMTAAKELQPENPDVYIALGDAYVKQNVIPLGVDNYKRAVELRPKDLTTTMKAARSLERVKQWTEAVKFYKTAVEMEPNNPDANYRMGLIYTRAKQWRNAIPPLKKYTELKPQANDADTLLMKSYFNSNSFNEAGEFARKVLKRDSSNADTWRSLAYALVEQKKYEEALGAFVSLQRRMPLTGDDLVKYGTALYSLKREDEALKVFEDAIRADSTAVEPYNPLGIIYMRKQDYAKAVEMFEKKIALDPKDPRIIGTYLNAGSSYMALASKAPNRDELFGKARTMLFKAKELNAENLQIRFRIAQYYAQMDSTEQMIAEYDEVITKATEQPEKYKKELGEAYAQKGNYYFGKKQFGPAMDMFRRAAAAGFDNAAFRITWGQAGLQLIDRGKDSPEEIASKLAEVQRHLERAVTQEPNNAQAHFWLGQTLVLERVEGSTEKNKELKAKACEEFRKTLRLDPRNEDAKKTMERIGC